MSSPWTTGTARLTARGGIDVSNGKVSVEDVYTIVLEPGARPVPGVGGIPDFGDPHPDATPDTDDPLNGLFVTGVSPSQPDPTSSVWHVRVTYGTGEKASDDEGDDSGTWVSKRIGFAHYQETLDTDSEGTVVANSAGDAFEDAPQVDRSLVEYTFVKRCRTSPAASVVSLHDTINDAPVTVLGQVIPARCGRLALEAEQNAGENWTMTIRITVNPATWDLKVLQNGYRYKDINGNLVKFTDTTADGRVVECSTPQLLGPVPEGGDGRGRGPYYATFKPYRAESWSDLHLPSRGGGSSSSSGGSS